MSRALVPLLTSLRRAAVSTAGVSPPAAAVTAAWFGRGTVPAVSCVRAARLLATLLPGLVCGCILYTDEINQAPTVRIADGARAGFRGTAVTLSALVSDDGPSDRVKLVWMAAEGTCATLSAASWATREATPGPLYPFKATRVGSYCVRVVATDGQGATATAEVDIDGRNRAPRPVLEHTTDNPGAGPGVRLHSDVRLSAERTSDDDLDAWTAQLRLTTPDGMTREAPRCPGATEGKGPWCFRASTPGQHAVELVVDDRMDSAVEHLLLEVGADAPPCIKDTIPPPGLPLVFVPREAGRLFEILRVDDDGEAFPGGKLGDPVFVWSAGRAGESLDRLGGNAPRWLVGESLFGRPRPDDVFHIQVEVRDQAWEAALRGKTAELRCPPGEPVCRVNGCVRRVTWKVQFYP